MEWNGTVVKFQNVFTAIGIKIKLQHVFTQFFTLFKVIKSINYLNPHAISHSNSVLVQMAQMQQYKQLFRLEVTPTLDKRLMVHYVVSATKQKIYLPIVK